MIPDHIKEEVRAAADIVEVISDYVKLRRTGSNFQGLCPFHNEKSPSFNVSPQLGIYKCFGCGESGDVFSFVMKKDGVGFTEAIRMIGSRFGIDVPEEQQPEQDEQYRLKEGIFHALSFAGRFFYVQLTQSDAGRVALNYLEKRKFSVETIKKYGLGYAPDSYDALIKAAVKQGINEQYLYEGGLIKYGRNGETAYDAFRHRLMFPIFNASAKVIGFGGRILPGADGTTPKNAPKYINSAQTKVYNKSEVLYGIHVAKNEIRRNSEVILVEGYTDVLALHQASVLNVVATSGTALTAEQLKVMHRYGETLLMIYDADMAGQNAMSRGLDLALREGLDVRLLQLPEGEDPDSYIRGHSKADFMKYRDANAKDMVAFTIDKMRQTGKWDDPFHRKNTISTVLRSIAHIPDEITRETYIQRLSELTGLGTRPLSEELGVHRAAVMNADSRRRSDPPEATPPSLRPPQPGPQQTGRPASNPGTSKSTQPTASSKSANKPQKGAPVMPDDRFGPPGIPDDYIPAEADFGDGIPYWPDPTQLTPPDEGSFGYQRTIQANHQPDRPGREQGAFSGISMRRPAYEREILRLMLQHGHPMVEYIGSQCNDEHFEDPEYRMLFNDMIQRYADNMPISATVYTSLAAPFPQLVGEVLLDRHTPSTRANERSGRKVTRDKDPFLMAKGELRSLKIHYLGRLSQEFQQQYATAPDDTEKQRLQQLLMEVTRQGVRFQNETLKELFPDPIS
jgi:DNA primase